MHDDVAQMLSGRWYLPNTPELIALRDACGLLIDEFNALPADRHRERERLLARLFGACGRGVEVVPSLRCAYGFNVTVGDRVFINSGAFLMDDGPITIGDDVRIGPSAILATPLHPIDDHRRRRAGYERTAPIVIADNCWLGSGVTVSAGVTIGRNTVVGAGSVVVRDLPDHVVAVGSPAAPIRELPAETAPD
ncbi:galactoside O-acetyltransferase [Gordonia hirsuta DSM 44140 = NBRC 16056]|uniref:Galactoside O-acetyltransferase n=1 Tax=Gordonia hirsuta DSM 44140 = NBRC 16056 TaxID=1121927 RepID=L7L971_9ACTN|nr:sugar O-acetyltransferase [Gordonia hirsuta]GAC56592.1 galactoside O-acetyltransferase [Gordonia hirsuta DSM 44140 = NBRC 16056]